MITYNNKNILKSFIGNNRIVKKYLNNKIVYGIPDFAQYYNIQGYDNYEVLGDLTIINGIASGFMEGNASKVKCLILPETFPMAANSHIHLEFIPTQANFGTLIGRTGNNRNSIRIIAEYGNSLYLDLYDHTGRLVHQYFTYSSSLIVNNRHSFDLLYNGSTYTLILKDLDADVERLNTTYNYTQPSNIGDCGFAIGATKSDIWYVYLKASVNLNNSYIRADGKYWFNGNPNYKELLDCNHNVYLQNNSNWNAYIDMGIIPNKDVKFEISAQLVDTTKKDGALFGCRKSSSPAISNFVCWYNNLTEGYGAFNYGASYVKNWSPGISNPYQKQTYLYDGNNVYINDVVQTSGYDANKSAFSTDLTIYLFGYRADNSLQSRTFRGRVFYFMFYMSGTLVQHLVPVPKGLQIGSYKVPSNGMFDIVTQTFFENKGSGEFIWGVDL